MQEFYDTGQMHRSQKYQPPMTDIWKILNNLHAPLWTEKDCREEEQILSCVPYEVACYQEPILQGPLSIEEEKKDILKKRRKCQLLDIAQESRR